MIKLEFTQTPILYIALCFITSSLLAQETISTIGGEASGSGGTVSYTAGQITYTTDFSNNGSVAKGVQQPYEIYTTSGVELTNINLQLSAYPNPTTDNFILKVEDIDLATLSYFLYDVQGKILLNTLPASISTTINMGGMAAGVYYIKIMQVNKPIKTFKIIKN